jgi:hypothetical protein
MESNSASNRILHCTDRCKEHLSNARIWAMANGCLDELESKLDYLRTYSKGPEEEWETHLTLDIPFHAGRFDFIATVYKKWLHVDVGQGPTRRPFMTIGMIWDENGKTWSMHS